MSELKGLHRRLIGTGEWGCQGPDLILGSELPSFPQTLSLLSYKSHGISLQSHTRVTLPFL